MAYIALPDTVSKESWAVVLSLEDVYKRQLPAKLVEYLKTGPLRLEFPERELVKWAELYSFMDVQEMTWKRKKLLSLMVQMDNYSDYLLLWSPRDKKLWYLDIEHEEFHPCLLYTSHALS